MFTAATPWTRHWRVQAAIAAAGAQATANSRRIIKLKAGTYYVTPQTFPGGGQVGIYVNVDNVTIRGEGPNTTRIAAAGPIPSLGTVTLFGHRSAGSDAAYRVQYLTADAEKGANTLSVANAGLYAVGDVTTVDQLDGPAQLPPAVIPPPGFAGLGAGQRG